MPVSTHAVPSQNRFSFSRRAVLTVFHFLRAQLKITKNHLLMKFELILPYAKKTLNVPVGNM
jgi:hypothetical protein